MDWTLLYWLTVGVSSLLSLSEHFVVSELGRWCFKPSQPQRIILGLRTTFIKRHIVEITNKAQIRPPPKKQQQQKQNEKAESCWENLSNEIQSNGPYRQKETQGQNKKEWASSVGLCPVERYDCGHHFVSNYVWIFAVVLIENDRNEAQVYWHRCGVSFEIPVINITVRSPLFVYGDWEGGYTYRVLHVELSIFCGRISSQLIWFRGFVTTEKLTSPFALGFICCLNVINRISTEIINFIQHIRMLCLLLSLWPTLFFFFNTMIESFVLSCILLGKYYCLLSGSAFSNYKLIR